MTLDLANLIAWACIVVAVWQALLAFARTPPGYYALESPTERLDRVLKYLVWAAVIWAVMHGR